MACSLFQRPADSAIYFLHRFTSWRLFVVLSSKNCRILKHSPLLRTISEGKILVEENTLFLPADIYGVFILCRALFSILPFLVSLVFTSTLCNGYCFPNFRLEIRGPVSHSGHVLTPGFERSGWPSKPVPLMTMPLCIINQFHTCFHSCIFFNWWCSHD